MCVDYRKLNAITIKGAYPLLRIDDILNVCLFFNIGFGEWLLANRDEVEAKKESAFVRGEVMPFGW